jgi:hypothetical protein
MSKRRFLVMLAIPGILPSITGTFAQDAARLAQNPTAEAARVVGAGDTLKERLSDKASDEQRVDNCKVPADRRGAKQRPDTCAPSGGAIAAPRGHEN